MGKSSVSRVAAKVRLCYVKVPLITINFFSFIGDLRDVAKLINQAIEK